MADIVERLRGLADLFEAGDAPRHLVLHMRAGADEIDRLRAGGCARDQGTTQYCAEAAKLAAENERLRAALERMLLEFDFMVESGVISDVRNDIIFVEARAALEGRT